MAAFWREVGLHTRAHDELTLTALELRDDGCTLRQIAEYLSVQPGSVHRMITAVREEDKAHDPDSEPRFKTVRKKT